MQPRKLRNYKVGPESKIQDKLIRRLMMDGWFVKETHGNEFQAGFPDLFACHLSYGSRWIEVKQPKGYKIKDSQYETFQEFTKRNVGVWILTDDSTWEVNKLLQPANWYTFLTAFQTHNRASKPHEKPKESRQQPDGPERRIQDAIKKTLEARDWYCKDTHGNIFQYGFPDLYVCHKQYGARWIEVKNPTSYQFTAAQLKTFPLMQAHGCGVWLATSSAWSDLERLLFGPSNWWQYLDAWKS